MADNSSGSAGILGVIIGAVIVIAVAFFLLGGDFTGKSGAPGGNLSINVEPPAAPSGNAN